MTGTVDQKEIRRQGQLAQLVTYLLALLVAFGVGWWFRQLHPLVSLALADVAGTLVVFAASVYFNNTSMYDPYWSMAPPFLVLGWWWLAGHDLANLRFWLVFALVCLWSLRLTTNFLKGWPGLHHEDWRYVNFRKTGPWYWPISFAGLHFFPTVMVFLGCLSLYVVACSKAPLSWLDGLAALVTFLAVAIEYVSDEQLRDFVKTNTDPEAFLQTGLWRYSRHPNYFGECLFWTGCYLFSLAAAPALWWTVAGPVTMFALFLFVSIPMIDKRMKKKRPAYAEHQKQVSALFPWFPKKG